MKLSVKTLLNIAGLVVLIVGIISNIDASLYYNATQYVPSGEKPQPLRMMELVGDIVQPVFYGFVLFALAHIAGARASD